MDASVSLNLSPFSVYKGVAAFEKEVEAETEVKLKVDLRLNLTNPEDLDMGTWNHNAISVHNALVYATDLAADRLAKAVRLKQNSVGAIFARFGRALAFDWFLASLYVGGVAHETFGHAAAGRRYGRTVTQDFVPPRFGSPSSNGLPILTWEQDVYATGIGPEVTSQIGFLLTKAAMAEGRIRYNHSIFVTDTLLDIVNYVLFQSPIWMKPPNKDNFLGDPGDYFKEMTDWSCEKKIAQLGIKEVADKKLCEINPGFSWETLEVGAGLALLNLPFHIYNIGCYIATGKKNLQMPFIWPHYTFMLAPPGPKSRLDLLVRIDELNGMLFDPHYSITLMDRAEERTHSFGLDISNIKVDGGKWLNFILGAGFDVWHHPDNGWGGAGKLSAVYSPKVCFGALCDPKVGLETVGKTHGHLFGEILEEGWTARLILGFKLEVERGSFR